MCRWWDREGDERSGGVDGSGKNGKETEDSGKSKADDCDYMVEMAHQLGFEMGGPGLDVGTLDAIISEAGRTWSGEATVEVSDDKSTEGDTFVFVDNDEDNGSISCLIRDHTSYQVLHDGFMVESGARVQNDRLHRRVFNMKLQNDCLVVDDKIGIR